MKLMYLYDGGDMRHRVLTGIDHKVLAQVKTFNENEVQCELVCPPRRGNISTLLQCIPFFPDRTIWSDALTTADVDAVYLRRPVYVSKELIAQLKRLRKRLPHVKILFEIPTWPYDKEMQTPRYLPVLIKDRIYRRRLKGLVDYIVDISGTDNILGIPTIHIHNGIDLDLVRKRHPSYQSDCVHLVFVAMFSEWHGADRVLEGLKLYMQSDYKQRIIVHFVGEGPSYRNLVNLTKEYRLESCVMFHGNCNREEMDHIYDECTMGIASLGLHRIGIGDASTLKTREYLAKGLPFVYSGAIQEFEQDPVDFCLQFTDDESPIDIDDVIDFHKLLYEKYSEEDLINRIRRYAEMHIGMTETLRPVIEVLQNGD